jgi:hypothetical protein
MSETTDAVVRQIQETGFGSEYQPATIYYETRQIKAAEDAWRSARELFKSSPGIMAYLDTMKELEQRHNQQIRVTVDLSGNKADWTQERLTATRNFVEFFKLPIFVLGAYGVGVTWFLKKQPDLHQLLTAHEDFTNQIFALAATSTFTERPWR